MLHSKENFKKIVEFLDENNIVFFKDLYNRKNEIGFDNVSNNTIKSILNKFGFSMREFRIKKVIELTKSGFTIKQISEILGMNSKPAISTIRSKYGVKTTKHKRKFKYKRHYYKIKLIDLIKEHGWRPTKIANMLNTNYNQIIKAVKYHKLDEKLGFKIKRKKKKYDIVKETILKYNSAKNTTIAKYCDCSERFVRSVKKELRDKGLI